MLTLNCKIKIMIPKEKAKELFDKMSKQTYKYQPYAGARYLEEEVGYEAGKKFALICVDEILEEIDIIDILVGNLSPKIGYWIDVKKEIEKL